MLLWSWWLLASVFSYSFKQLYYTNLTIYYYNISIYWLHSFRVTDDTCQISSTTPHVLMHLPIPSLYRCGQHFLSFLSSNSVSTRTTGGFRLEIALRQHPETHLPECFCCCCPFPCFCWCCSLSCVCVMAFLLAGCMVLYTIYELIQFKIWFIWIHISFVLFI